MNYSDRQELTEECPLTNGRNDFCGGGLKIIICSFAVLTIAVTATLILQLLYVSNVSQEGAGVHGAVVTDHTNCSQIGITMLRKGGNAVDSAVAAAICMTVVAPHKTGLGGGGYVMIYSHKDRVNPLIIDFANNTIDGAFAAENIRVPAILRGLEFAQSLHGNLQWYEVIEPSAELARVGFVVSKEFAREVSKSSNVISGGIPYDQLEAGQILQIPKLADTLNAVALYGSDVLYNGTLSHMITSNTEELRQLAHYEPKMSVAKEMTFYHHTIYYPQHAISLKLTLDGLEALHIPAENASTVESQILVAKTIVRDNVAYSKMYPNVEEQKYTNVVTMDWQDTYVSIITGLSAPFGKRKMTDAGFLMDGIGRNNNLASLTPIIFHHETALCGLRGAFGTDDMIVSGQLLYNLLVRTFNISAAVEHPRYYLRSDGIAIESDESHSIDTMLRVQLDSMTNLSRTDASYLAKSTNIIVKYKDSMISYSDSTEAMD